MEAFTLLALQFCDGEDLMSLYWSTFTMIQVGSLIAVMGIIVALLHSLRDRKHPYVSSPLPLSFQPSQQLFVKDASPPP
jgi:hypothetical protein